MEGAALYTVTANISNIVIKRLKKYTTSGSTKMHACELLVNIVKIVHVFSASTG